MFTLPTSGASRPSSPTPTFVWQPTPTDTGAPEGRVTCSECSVCHLPPVSGDVFDLQFSVGGAVVYRIVFTSQHWTPPDALWASWKAKRVSIAAYRMTLKVNDPVDGPFTATEPVVFQVAP